MIKTSARRFSLALILGATSLLAAGTAHADGTTGTDPCPKGMLCSTNSTPATSTSTPTTAVQVLLVLLGVS